MEPTVQELASLVQAFLNAWDRQAGARNSIAVNMKVRALKGAMALVKQEVPRG